MVNEKMDPAKRELVPDETKVKMENPLLTVLRGLRKKFNGMVGLIIIVVFVLVAILAPLIVPNPPREMDLPNRHLPPFSRVTKMTVDHTQEDPDLMFQEREVHYILGTDHAGRCVLSRIIMGARMSLAIGFGVVIIRFLIGVPLGLLAGFNGGKMIDSIIMRIADGIVVFPNLLLALAIMAVRGPGIENIYLALSLVGWTGVARVVRAETLSLRERDFVQASRAMGATNVRILIKHVLPNCVAPLLVLFTLGVAAPILGEAALSFLGLGAQPPQISWGLMISQAREMSPIVRGRWWQILFPGFGIFFVVMGFNLLGDALRDVLDPRMKGT